MRDWNSLPSGIRTSTNCSLFEDHCFSATSVQPVLEILLVAVIYLAFFIFIYLFYLYSIYILFLYIFLYLLRNNFII